jgi:hypothetical protein
MQKSLEIPFTRFILINKYTHKSDDQCVYLLEHQNHILNLNLK